MENISTKTKILGVPVVHCTGNGTSGPTGKEHYCASSVALVRLEKLCMGRGKDSPGGPFDDIAGCVSFNGVPVVYNSFLDEDENAETEKDQCSKCHTG